MAKPSKKRVERSSQLEQAKRILSELQAELKSLERKDKWRSDLSDHLEGFYEEIDKLAKGRTLVEATPLVVDQVNDIIRDAKQIVENDVYLDRIKQFVPAGNNPVYPDVLVVARAVQQSLDRSEPEFERQRNGIIGTSTRAKTVVGALECFLSGEENSELALEEDVDRYVDGPLDTSCFYENEDLGDECFDFDELDSQTVEQYIRRTKVGQDGDEESEADGTGVEDSEEEQEEQEEAEE